jgi:protein TonB
VGWAGAVVGGLVAVAGFAWFVGPGTAVSSSPPVFVAGPDRPPEAPPRTVTPPVESKTPPVVSTTTTVRPTRPVAKPVPAPEQKEAAQPIESATPPEGPLGNANAQQPRSAQPLPPADVAPSTNHETVTPIATPRATPAPADVITPPTRTRTVPPVYPDVARAGELQGDVLLQATVGTDGRISNVRVLRAVHPLLDEAARRAVLQYEYTPGRRNGIPEPATVRITVSFRLR